MQRGRNATGSRRSAPLRSVSGSNGTNGGRRSYLAGSCVVATLMTRVFETCAADTRRLLDRG